MSADVSSSSPIGDVEGLPALGIKWPSFQPVIIRCHDELSEMMFRGLHKLLEQRPLLTFEVMREELLGRTMSYHAMGYPDASWMSTVEAVWSGLYNLYQQERKIRWEMEALPRILQLRERLDPINRAHTALVQEFVDLSRHEHELSDTFKAKLPQLLSSRRDYLSLREAVTLCLRSMYSTGVRLQQIQQQMQEHQERRVALKKQISELEESRP